MAENKRQGRNVGSGGVSVCGGTAVPETSPEVIAAGHKARIGGRVDNTTHYVVVSQGQQVFPLRRTRVPATQANGAFIW